MKLQLNQQIILLQILDKFVKNNLKIEHTDFVYPEGYTDKTIEDLINITKSYLLQQSSKQICNKNVLNGIKYPLMIGKEYDIIAYISHDNTIYSVVLENDLGEYCQFYNFDLF